MTDKNIGASMNSKKVWTAPAIQVISLNSARNKKTGAIFDGSPAKS